MIRRALLLLCLGGALVCPRAADSVEVSKRAVEWIESARLDASEGRYALALGAIDSILVRAPGDFEARLLRARIFSWQGRFADAERTLAELLTERPDDGGARLALASLRYYQGRLDEAAIGFQTLLAEDATNSDARDGLNNVQRARAAPKPGRWRVDAGGEYSLFTRRSQTDWNQQFAQLSRRLDDDNTVVEGRVDRFDRFGNTDFALEAGLSREWLPGLRAAFSGSLAPGADFRPAWGLAADAEWRAIPSLWVLAGGRYDVYADAEFLGLSPGLRFAWGDPWSLTTKLSQVLKIGGESVTGWSARLDGSTGSPRLGPVRENARFWLGIADAPETVASTAGVNTVSTVTLFFGTALDFAKDWTLNLGYARDDREHSWVRHVFNAGIARNF